MKKQITILGSTGSIGTQTLDVIRRNPDKFEVYAITANNQDDLLIEQAKEFHPEFVVIANEAKYEKVKDALSALPMKVYTGAQAIADVASMSSADIVVTAMVGYAGLLPTINAIKAGKTIALANKETLVVAGELIQKLVQEYHSGIIPVDSEHSAIFQCLAGEEQNEIEKLIITASGGPFRTKSIEELATVSKADALKHPNWSMGAKITIDSASMMNKGFEVIEAKWLFGIDPKNIEVVVHPQSIIHSMVQFSDGAIKAQLGMPDMKVPIQYALTYPDRTASTFPRIDWRMCSRLDFEQPDVSRFRNLQLAFDAMKQAGNKPCVLNAANEIVVRAFLNDRISFLKMSDIIETMLAKTSYIPTPSLDDYIECDKETRRKTEELI
ncbi:MAG: 1-deoxy-D-xylulose-5-phosphate reductoisomerase [Paludibacteraceae bacterium]|nr:1-deoxy-D-xylulose-5-phosphate reductoisomerase [Paludibacteraceae bacterium]